MTCPIRDLIANRRRDPIQGRSMFKPVTRPKRGIPTTSPHVRPGVRHDTAPHTRNRPQ